ncbi:MAG: hypothetical protein ACXU95_18205 [Isosphaeraceae bacterium]
MNKRFGSLTVLSAMSAALCLATGAAYLTVSPTQLTVPLLVICGVVGAGALLSAGFWQQRVAQQGRRRALQILGLLGAGYAAANVFGFVGDRIARTARLEPVGLPMALHVAGIAAGLALFVAAMIHLLGAPRRTSRSM